MSATIMARQRREFGFRTLALRSLIGRVAGAGIGIAAAIGGAGLWSLAAQQVVIALVGSAVLWATCDHRPRLPFRAGEFGQLLRFGVAAVGSLFLGFSIKRLLAILAGASLGLVAAGFLNLSFRVVDVFWAIGAAAVQQVALPMLAKLQGDRDRLSRTYQEAVAYTCTVLYACFVGLAATAPEVVEILFAQQWLRSSPYVSALAVLVVAQAARLMVGPVLTALGWPTGPVIGQTIQLCVMLAALTMTQVPTVGWAVGIWVGCELVNTPISLWMVRRVAGFTVGAQLRGVVAPLTAAIVMACAVAAARRWLVPDFGAPERLACLVPVGAAAYLSVLWVTDRSLVTNVARFAVAAFRHKPVAAR